MNTEIDEQASSALAADLLCFSEKKLPGTVKGPGFFDFLRVRTFISKQSYRKS
jgi:hypothetical protein